MAVSEYEGMKALAGVAVGGDARPWLTESTFDTWKMLQSVAGVGINAVLDRRDEKVRIMWAGLLWARRTWPG